MKEIIADLRNITGEGGDILADHSVVQKLEDILLGYAGKVVHIRTTYTKAQKALVGSSSRSLFQYHFSSWLYQHPSLLFIFLLWEVQ